MNSREYSDELLDSLINVALKKKLDGEIENLPSDEELDNLVTSCPELDRKISKTIGRFYRKDMLRKFLINSLKAAVVIIVVSFISTIVLLNVEASRTAIYNMILEWRDDHASVNFSESKTPEQTGNKIQYPSYVPSGFIISDELELGNQHTTIYKNDVGLKVIIFQYNNDKNILDSVDSENAQFVPIELFGKEAYVFEASTPDTANVLYFQKDTANFKVTSHVNLEETIKIAESIK